MAEAKAFGAPGVRGRLHEAADARGGLVLAHGAGSDCNAPLLVAAAAAFAAAGRHQMPLITIGAIMGGNVRVGLEDSIYVGKGQLATSNADQVRRIRTILENLSLEIATPAEARQLLDLKGGDRVAF